MRAARFLALIMKAALAAMALAPKLVWEGGKWVAKSLFPGAPAEAAAAAGDVEAALSAPPASPALPPKMPTDPESDWGRIVKNFAIGHMSGSLDEPSLAGLDEAAEAWVRSLSTLDLARVAKLRPRTIGEHVFGSQAIRGLPRCLSIDEYNLKLIDAQIPGTDEYEACEAQAASLAEGIESLRAEGKLELCRGI